MIYENNTKPNNGRNKSAAFLEAIALMIILQGIRELSEWLIMPSIPDIRFAERILDMALMVLMTIVIIVYAKCRKQELSVFPKVFTKTYVIATCITVLLYIASPSNFTMSFASVLTIVYGSIVTPVYEELLFRGYLWNRFQKVMDSRVTVYILNIVLFALWHIGYMVPHIITGNWFAVLTKVAAGAVYGAILGFIRKKTGHCWSTILAHGVMNLLMI